MPAFLRNQKSKKMMNPMPLSALPTTTIPWPLATQKPGCLSGPLCGHHVYFTPIAITTWSGFEREIFTVFFEGA